MRNAVTDPKQLLMLLDLPHTKWLSGAIKAHQQFPLKVPMGFIQRMEKANPLDPLLRQVLPLSEELDTHPHYCSDPVNDMRAVCAPGLLHKYSGRALMITTGACAIHCRYCFRRAFPYDRLHIGGTALAKAIDYLKANPNIHEIILSGGDPLMLDDQQLIKIWKQIDSLAHIDTVRIHSRVPIVLPERITDSLLNFLKKPTQKIVLVVHTNHPNELNEPVKLALAALNLPNVVLLNQTVLLRGVNDQSMVLVQLSKKLFQYQVMPYYLHCLDKVDGTAHFDLPEKRAKQLHQELQSQLPGYLLPRLVREIPGMAGKTWI